MSILNDLIFHRERVINRDLSIDTEGRTLTRPIHDIVVLRACQRVY